MTTETDKEIFGTSLFLRDEETFLFVGEMLEEQVGMLN